MSRRPSVPYGASWTPHQRVLVTCRRTSVLEGWLSGRASSPAAGDHIGRRRPAGSRPILGRHTASRGSNPAPSTRGGSKSGVSRRASVANVRTVTDHIFTTGAYAGFVHAVRREHPGVITGDERTTVLALGHTPENSRQISHKFCGPVGISLLGCSVRFGADCPSAPPTRWHGPLSLRSRLSKAILITSGY